MTPTQMETFRAAMNIRADHEWDRFEGLRESPESIQDFLDRVPVAALGERKLKAAPIALPDQLAVTARSTEPQ